MTLEMNIGIRHTTERDPAVRAMVLEALRNFGERTLRYEGEQEGPSVLFVGGTHGNEILGVLVADMFRRELEAGRERLLSGTVRLMLGNTRAIEADQRTAPNGPDMGRMFTSRVLADPDAYGWEGRRVRAIADAALISDVGIDHHCGITRRPHLFVRAQAKRTRRYTNGLREKR